MEASHIGRTCGARLDHLAPDAALFAAWVNYAHPHSAVNAVLHYFLLQAKKPASHRLLACARKNVL
jgi:hypothetical protein